MANNTTNVLTSKQLIFTVVSLSIGTGILTLPSAVGHIAKQDAWISILLGALLILLGLFMINLIASRFPTLTFAEYAEAILGKWLGKILSLAFIAYCLVFAGIIVRLFVSILKIYIFPTTPVWVLVCFILAVIAYLVSKNVRVLARVNELMFYESVVLAVILLLALPNIDITFYRPLGEMGLKKVLVATTQTLTALTGVEFLLVFYPMVQRKKEFIKAGFFGVMLVAIIYLSVFMVILGVFGPDVLGQTRLALIVLTKTYTAPVIERAEFFFLIFYTFVAFRPISNMYFAGRYTLQAAVNIKSPVLVTLLMFPLILGVALYPKDFEQVISISLKIGYFGVSVFLFLIPLLLWFIALVRGLGVKQS